MQVPPFIEYLGIEVERPEQGTGVVTLDLAPHHLNRRGVAHGGVITAMLDSALGAAVISSIPEEWWCATTSLATQFVEGAGEGRLTARGTVTRRGAKVAFASGEVRDARGRLVATAQGTWHLWSHRPTRRERTAPSATVVMRSTMLPGSVDDEIVPVLEETSGMKAGEGFGVAYNPEFLREGTAIADFFGAEYTVIGAADDKSRAAMHDLYKGIGGEILDTSIRTAEMLKYVNNAYHALKVTFANEVGRICKREGVDSHEVMHMFIKDTRLNLSSYYLKPGFAFGGSCLPKDVRALNSRARRHDLELPVIQNVMRSNDLHVEEAIHLIERLDRRRVGVLGLSFKSETDDLRESPILRVIGTLVGKGYSLLLHDSNIDMERLLGANRRFVETEVPYMPDRMRTDLDEVVQNSEIIVVANGSAEYKDVGRLLKPGQVLVDLVHAVDRASLVHGEYHGLAW